MPSISAARFLAESLEAYGVTHVFFVPAILGHTLAEMESRTKIRRILAHSEKSAVYMADGYARATGRVGVSFAQCVGAANLAAALRDPLLGCSPMVVFTGGPDSDTRHRHTYQQIDDFPLFTPLTKYNAQVDRAARLPDVLRQAFRSATTGTPGPAHIELSGHLGELEQQVDELAAVAEPGFGRVPALRPPADPDELAKAARLIEQAQRPVIVAGGGVRSSGAGPELIELAERLDVPVATSLNAKDQIPGDHRLSVGVSGRYCRKSANQVVLEADLVLFVGSHTGSQVTAHWRVPPPSTPVIQIDVNPQELGRHYPNRASLLGDAKAVLRQLIGAVDPFTAIRRRQWTDRATTLVRQWRQESAGPMNSDAVPIRPERLCRELTELMPPETLLVADTGHSGMWTGGMIDLTKPGQGYIRAAGSLGWGLPAALGAKLAVGDRPVLLFSGDGGFWYHLAELETARRWNIDAVLLVNNNRSLNQVIDPCTQAYGGRLHGRHGELWQFSDVNLTEVARAIGIEALRVEKPYQLSGALEKAFSCGKPCLVEVITEITAMAPPAYLGETA